ncbi:hypothetical protein LC607_18520 [Nostoc sp. CHAB 5824]|nr:hypothetical protein [Nostoc sp. CHAB 5824]
MQNKRLSKTPSSINTNYQAAEQNPQLAYRQFGSQIQKASVAPVTQSTKEDVAFAEQKMEASELELQAKYGKITPERQARLTVLQAKMDGLLNSRLEHATQFGHNIVNIPLRRPDTELTNVVQLNTNVLQRVIIPQEKRDVPKLLHFIWSGRKISSQAQENIKTWAKIAKEKGWDINVWTDAVDSNWEFQTRYFVFPSNSIKLRNINEDIIDERLWDTYKGLIRGEKKKNYPAASDLARYSILQKYGGIYVDVDIAPGNVPLESTPLQRPELPLLGPEVRDKASVRQELEMDSKEEVTLDHINVAASRRIAKGLHNNNLIVSRANTQAMEKVILKVLENINKVGGARLLLDSPSDAALITGPIAVKEGLLKYLEDLNPEMDRGFLLETLNNELIHNWELEWITQESETQEH